MKNTILEPRQNAKKPVGSNVVTCAEAAEILRAADAILNPDDRAQIAAGIEEARRRMNNERLS